MTTETNLANLSKTSKQANSIQRTLDTYGRFSGRDGELALRALKPNSKLKIRCDDWSCEDISELLLHTKSSALMLDAVAGTLNMQGVWPLPPALIKMVSYIGSLCLLIQSHGLVSDWGSGRQCKSCAHTQLQGRLGDACVFNFGHSGWTLSHYHYNKESSFLELGKGVK